MEPNVQSAQPFRFRDPRQQRIYRRLLLVGPGPATFYRDACWLISNNPPIESLTHVIAHLLRDIESALRDVLEPVKVRSHQSSQPEVADVDGISHKEDIRAILQGLGIPETDPVAVAWLSFAGRGTVRGLHARAHRNNLDRPRSLDAEFLTFWDDLSSVLDIVLDRYEAQYSASLGILDRLLAQDNPSKKSISTLKTNVPNNLTTLSYFFDRLDNPLWLPELAKQGFFAYPPLPEYDPETQTWRLLPWPQSRYLARMAAKDPAMALRVIERIPATENVYVHADLLDAALAMPASVAVSMIPRAKTLIDSRYHHVVPERLGRLMAHLARGGLVDEALDLASELLVLRRDPRAEEEEQNGHAIHAWLEPTARFDHWDYERIVRTQVPVLIETARGRALTMVCDILSRANELTLHHREGSEIDDYSTSWLPEVEVDENHGRAEARQELVKAIRDAAEQMVESNQVDLRAVVESLESRRWPVFRRVALHLVRLFSVADQALLRERLVNRVLFEDDTVAHEYYRLLQEGFRLLDANAQQLLLAWIEEGPNLEAWSERRSQLEGQEPDKEQMERTQRVWQLDRLALIHNDLPPDWQNRYNDLISREGEPRHLEVAPRVRAGFVPSVSPLSQVEIASEAPHALVAFLGSWEPSNGWDGPTREGLGETLRASAVADPKKFSSAADQFRGLDPTYVRALISGLKDAVRAKTAIDWRPSLTLCCWVTEQPRQLPNGVRSDWHQDPDWTWARKEIASLLSAGLEPGEAEIPFELRDPVWQVLLPLSDDPDPTPEHEARCGGSNMDPYTMSINTIRGEAMHAVMRYARWCGRHLDSAQADASRGEVGLGGMPEVEAVLERHLDPGSDPSLTVRAVYGWWFPYLDALDHGWAASNIRRIFPTVDCAGDLALHVAAWDAYLCYHDRVYSSIFRLLIEQYRSAIDRLSTSHDATTHLINPDERLSEHLMILYWQGFISLDDADSLVRRLFEKAPVDIRRHALEFVGRSLNNSSESPPREVLDRLYALWNSRLAHPASQAASTSSLTELSAFGWWFCSGKLDDEWAGSNLTKVLRLVRWVEPDQQVVDRLVELCAQKPSMAVECLSLLVDGARESWQIDHWRQQVREILTSALQSDDMPARAAAAVCINRLVARGFVIFRDLLRSMEPRLGG